LTTQNVWIEVADSFYAQGGETYVTIGNFYDDVNTDTAYVQGGIWVQYGYYFIDDVSVYLCDTTTGFNDPNNMNDLLIYPNPAKNMIHIKNISETSSITLIDRFGKRLLKKHTVNDNCEFNIDELPPGIYFLDVSFKNSSIRKKIVVIE
jgi:hypothetical protein